MSSTFPLLSALQSQVTDSAEALSQDELLALSKDIRQFGKEPAERVYGLIRAYSLEAGGISTMSLPYSGVNMKSGPKFDLDQLPEDLVHLLVKFVEIHKETHTK